VPHWTDSLPQAEKMAKKHQIMHRIAFKMKLYPGFAEEYKDRHDELLLKEKGVSDYSIFIDYETNTLFAVMKVTDVKLLDELSDSPVMQQWWQYMSDIMETNADNSPERITLKEIFHLA
jgi:L-rhamnose mutarotase